MKNKMCENCCGTGKIRTAHQDVIECDECNGTGLKPEGDK